MNMELSFLSENEELNASISRYFRYVHQLPVTTYQSPITIHHSHIRNVLVVHNEVNLNGEICAIYPFWFAFGIQNNIKVYGFTYESTDFSNNLLNWEDILNLNWQDHFTKTIDCALIPYFDTSRSHLYGILRPHSGDSLLDLAATLHMTFFDAPRDIANLRKMDPKKRASAWQEIQTHVIHRGADQLAAFKTKEKKHQSFLSLLPGSPALFSSLFELETFMDRLGNIDANSGEFLGNISTLFEQIKTLIIPIYRFFENLEPFLQGEFN